MLRWRGRTKGGSGQAGGTDRVVDGVSSGTVAAAAASGGEQRVGGYRIVNDRAVEERRIAEEKARRSSARRYHLTDRLGQFVDYLFYLLYGLLALRLLLGLMAASEDAGFVQFMQRITDPFYGPFAGIVGSVSFGEGVFEVPIVVAIFVYLLLHIAVRGLLRVLAGNRRATA